MKHCTEDTSRVNNDALNSPNLSKDPEHWLLKNRKIGRLHQSNVSITSTFGELRCKKVIEEVNSCTSWHASNPDGHYCEKAGTLREFYFSGAKRPHKGGHEKKDPPPPHTNERRTAGPSRTPHPTASPYNDNSQHIQTTSFPMYSAGSLLEGRVANRNSREPPSCPLLVPQKNPCIHVILASIRGLLINAPSYLVP